MWIFAQNTLEFLAANDAAVQSYGYDRNEFLRMSILEIRPVEDTVAVLRDALPIHESDGVLEHWRHQKKTGEILDVEITCHELLYDKRPARLVVVRKQTPVLRPPG